MKVSEFSGSPGEIGEAYGKAFAGHIAKNIDILVKRNCMPPDPLPFDNPDFINWVEDQEKIIEGNWPWLIEEMYGVADGSGQEFCDILYLNLRVWQYGFYSGKSDTACSSMVVTLADGSVANVGALDDACELYDGMFKIVPEEGCSYFTFPIIGTCWGNRGMNSAGLCIGISSQILQGLQRLPGSICSDIANRIILQTCETADDVREFCNKHPFTLNLVCSDKNGDVFCGHQTTAGLFEMSQSSPCVLTNHVADDMIMYQLADKGVGEFKESSTTRLRRGRFMEFYARFNGKCTAEDVRKYVADRMNGNPSSICPEGNIVLTYANPQIEPELFWISQPQATNTEEWIAYTL